MKIILVIMLLIQVIFSQKINYKQSNEKIILIKSIFGDAELNYRINSFRLQNYGDSLLGVKPLGSYDYNELYNWFMALDKLNNKSNFIASLAAYYFALTQNQNDLEYVVKYLLYHANKDLNKNWWWQLQAVNIINYKLKDKKRALKYSNHLAEVKDVPIWVKQLPAFIYEDIGQKQQAAIIINDIIKNIDNIDDKELNFMHYYLKERLK